MTELQNFWKLLSGMCQRDTQYESTLMCLTSCGEDVARDLLVYFQCLTLTLALTEATLNTTPVVTPEPGLTNCVEDENRQDIATYVLGELSDKIRAQEIEKRLRTRLRAFFSG